MFCNSAKMVAPVSHNSDPVIDIYRTQGVTRAAQKKNWGLNTKFDLRPVHMSRANSPPGEHFSGDGVTPPPPQSLENCTKKVCLKFTKIVGKVGPISRARDV